MLRSILRVFGVVLLILACLAAAWLIAYGEAYDLPWFDVDPLWSLAP